MSYTFWDWAGRTVQGDNFRFASSESPLIPQKKLEVLDADFILNPEYIF